MPLTSEVINLCHSLVTTQQYVTLLSALSVVLVSAGVTPNFWRLTQTGCLSVQRIVKGIDEARYICCLQRHSTPV